MRVHVTFVTNFSGARTLPHSVSGQKNFTTISVSNDHIRYYGMVLLLLQQQPLYFPFFSIHIFFLGCNNTAGVLKRPQPGRAGGQTLGAGGDRQQGRFYKKRVS